MRCGRLPLGDSAFAVYLRTLAPGLVAVVDTPMFQFIGRVLGVPHNPGYPLYVLLTFPFSYLPIGTLPYRINLFSAILGALTVSLAFLIARRLGCRRIVSAAAALGHGLRTYLLVAGHYCRGLHARLRNCRGYVARSAGLGADGSTRILLHGNSVVCGGPRQPHDNRRLRSWHGALRHADEPTVRLASPDAGHHDPHPVRGTASVPASSSFDRVSQARTSNRVLPLSANSLAS